MRKNLLVAASLALTAPFAAFAGIGLEVRTDYDHRFEYNDMDNVKFKGRNQFNIPFARLSMDGKVSDITMKARLNLAKANEATTLYTDATTRFIEIAYAEKNLMEGLNLQVGKIAIPIGGVEGSYENSYAIRYSLAGEFIPYYHVGAALNYDLMGQKLSLQYVNSKRANSNLVDPQNDTATDTENKTHGFGASFAGSFMDKMIMPMVSYHSLPINKREKSSYLAIGSQFNVQNASLDVDYLKNTSENLANHKEDTTKSLVFAARYKFGDIVPELKVDLGNFKDDEVEQYDRNAYTLTLRYMPKDGPCYHIAYDSLDYDYKTTSSNHDHKENRIVAGVVLTADLLK